MIRYLTGFILACLAQAALVDCTLPNLGLAPLNELGPNTYPNGLGGLYSEAANTRSPAHEAAGIQIAINQIMPLNAAGNMDTNHHGNHDPSGKPRPVPTCLRAPL